MLAILRQRNVALLWCGGLISLAGDWMLFIALPIYVYQLTGSTLATSAMFMAGMAPKLLFGSLAGVFVDRWDRKTTMVIANLLLALGLLPLLVVRSAEWLWVVYIVAFVEASIGQFFAPAEHALLPLLVDEEHLPSANALNALNNNLARLAGPPLGGLAAAVLGLHGVVILDAASFLVAAALIALITVREPARRDTPPGGRTTEALLAVWREWLAGLRLVRREGQLSVIFVLEAITAVGEGVFSVLFIVFVGRVLGGGAQELGWLMGAQAIGGLIGSVLVGPAGRRLAPARLLGLSAIAFGLLDLAIFNYPAVVPGLALGLMLFVLVGVPGAGYATGVTTMLQIAVPDRYRGRIFGAYTTTTALLALIGTIIAGALGDLLGVVTVLNLQGCGYILAGLIALLLLRGPHAARSIRLGKKGELDRAAPLK